MGKEIERKFLVKGDAWKALAPGIRYRQGYLNSSFDRTVRVRTIGDQGFITVKGPNNGIAMLDRFKGLGWKKLYLIFGMSDESFALEFATKAPEGVDSSWYMMWITFLDRMYWLGGAVLGATLGSFLTFDTKGLSFVMTAMFVVIFLEQFLKEKHHWTAWIGFGASLGCLALFGRDFFMISTMVVILLLLTVFRKPIEEKGGYEE